MALFATGSGWNEKPLVFVEDTDPDYISRVRAQDEQAKRNTDWYQAHWNELVPPNYGKYLAIAGQEAFLAETVLEAQAQAVAAHPEDKGVIVMFISPPKGPRIYENRR